MATAKRTTTPSSRRQKGPSRKQGNTGDASSAAEKQINVDDLKLMVSPTIQTVWIDKMAVSMRSDGIATLAFQTAMAEHGMRVEAIRVQTTIAHLKRIIDVLCRTTGHYPAPARTDADDDGPVAA